VSQENLHRISGRLRGSIWRARDRLKDWLGGQQHRQGVFTRIYDQNLWGSNQSKSGPGSSPDGSREVALNLPRVWSQYGIRSLVDAPCGDFAWMQHIVGALGSYVGADIVPAAVAANQERFGRPGVRFVCADLTRDALPRADAILCRDCFQHLPTRMIQAALRNFSMSGARWLLLTHNEDVRAYSDAPIGSYRPINFRLAPFNFPAPLDAIDEDDKGRKLALWEIRGLELS
jgi:SAM-dependent methyltransferase